MIRNGVDEPCFGEDEGTGVMSKQRNEQGNDQRAAGDGQESQPPARGARGMVIRVVAGPAAGSAAAVPAEQEEASAPRVVEVRNLEEQRAGRVFPCLNEQRVYTGCIGYERCDVLCWAPRPREREAVVRVDQPTGAPCRSCEYAREVYGTVAVLNGREVRLMECRLGFWHGRAPLGDFLRGKIPINVRLPCPGLWETEAAHPALERARRKARLRKQERGS
jgi:hypothetical protein